MVTCTARKRKTARAIPLLLRLPGPRAALALLGCLRFVLGRGRFHCGLRGSTGPFASIRGGQERALSGRGPGFAVVLLLRQRSDNQKRYEDDRWDAGFGSGSPGPRRLLLTARCLAPVTDLSSLAAMDSRRRSPQHLLPLPLALALLLGLAAVLAPSLAAAPGLVIRLPAAGGKAGARACAAPPDPAAPYDRPVIGIVSHPGDGAGGRISNATAASYIGASYVKFVEAAGARVVPLVYNEPEERLLEKLSLVNGVLFTGGSEKKGLYFETIKKVFQYVLDKNDAGEPFPLFAECLGFELVSMIVSKDNNVLETFDALDQASTLQFPSYSFEGSVFQRFDSDLIKKVSTRCLVMQNHRYGISPRRLQENDALSSFFRILTTSPDENGKVYVSTVEAHNYPITCTQWHPEKAIFEWRKPMIPHSEDAVQVTQHFANHFISQARKSPNRPPADKVLDNLIYNYSPTFSGKTSKSFEEVYIFS